MATVFLSWPEDVGDGASAVCHLVCGVIGIQKVKILTKASIVKPFMASHTLSSVGETR